MLRKVKDFIMQENMIKPDDALIVAVSGGPDSMALLHLLLLLKEEMNLRLVVAHLNHQLRPEADQEEEMVKKSCQQWQLPFYSRRVDVEKLAAQEKRSLEDMGRICRYQFFRQLKNEQGCQSIATAHHQDDQAESVLLHLIRGSGIKGLRGMLPVTGDIIRPLLCITRQEIEAYVKQQEIPFCQDASNKDPSFLRNRIRHQLIPLLKEEYNPRMVEILNGLAQIARWENDIMEKDVIRLWPQVILEHSQDMLRLDINVLKGLHPAYQKRLIWQAFYHLTGYTDWSLADVERVQEILEVQGSSLVLHLQRGVKVNRVYRELLFSYGLPDYPPFCYALKVPGEVYIKEIGQRITISMRERYQERPGRDIICLDANKITKPLFIRSRQEGDYIHLPSGKGRKKIKKLFIDLKIPRWERNQIPLVAAGSEVYAILGYQVSPQAKVTRNTSNILVIKREFDAKTR